MEERQRPIIPLPAETFQDTAAERVAAERVNHWLDEAYEQFVQNGGLDKLPGIGKPLVVPTGNVLESILKNAKAAPPWVMLRKEIHGELEEIVQLQDKKVAIPDLDQRLREINAKIAELNVKAPSLTLHRKKITRDNLREQLELWR